MLARLVVQLRSNHKHLQTGLTKSAGLVRSFAGGLSRMAGGLGALVTAGAVVAGVKTQLEELDKVAKLNSATGFGASLIQGLGFGAEQSGSNVETLRNSLKKFSITMGQVAQGTGPGISGLRALGLNFEQLAALTPDEQLLSVADAMKALPNEAARNAAAMQLFGRSGAELTNLLGQGRAGLRAFIDEADNLGLGFDREELARVEAANDALNRIKRTVGAAFGALTVAVAPIIETVSGGILRWVEGFGGLKAIVADAGAWWRWLQGEASRSMAVAMATAEFAMQNWRQVGELAVQSVALGFVRFGAEQHHLFTAVMPSLFSWFGRNWKDLFFTAFDLATTVFANLGQNIRNAMSAIWDFIASGGSKPLQLTWKPLTDGFVNSLKELPDIPQRVMGPVEAGLQKRVDELSEQLGGDLNTLVRDRLEQLSALQASGAIPADAAPGQFGNQSGNGTGFDDEPGAESDRQTVGALSKGSQEAFSAIIAAMRQRGENKVEKIAADQLSETQTQTALMLEADRRARSAPVVAVLGTLD